MRGCGCERHEAGDHYWLTEGVAVILLLFIIPRDCWLEEIGCCTLLEEGNEERSKSGLRVGRRDSDSDSNLDLISRLRTAETPRNVLDEYYHPRPLNPWYSIVLLLTIALKEPVDPSPQHTPQDGRDHAVK